jgi:hypothetical protein
MTINRCYALDRLLLWPRWHPIEQHFSQTPHSIRQPRCHRWRPRLPALDGTGPGHGLELWQGQAQAGMGQHKIVVGVEQSQLLAQSRFVFAQRVDPPTNGCYMLTKIQIQAFDEGGVDLPTFHRI